MNIMHINIIAAFLAIATVANAQSSPDIQLIRSKPSDDLVLTVSVFKTHDMLYTTSSIQYGWLSVTNKYTMVFLPKDEYLCCAQMYDSMGNTVPLRSNAKNMGKHFFDLKYPSVDQLWDAIEDRMRIRPPHGTQGAAAESVFAGLKSSEGRTFPCPEDIFQIKKTGLYKVKLQFQAYERIYKGGHSFTYKLERFEPLEFTVTKK
jgi:hypothetical protein